MGYLKKKKKKGCLTNNNKEDIEISLRILLSILLVLIQNISFRFVYVVIERRKGTLKEATDTKTAVIVCNLFA